jgi:aryl-alcohol dehydrogenase-like predicted oxidoreductase
MPLSDLDTGEAVRILREAHDRGCNFFDTAPRYGYGRNETQIGDAFAGIRDEVVICTKYGLSAGGVVDFDPARLKSSVESSLERLRTDTIDVLLLHNPPDEQYHGDHPVYEVLEALVAEGKIRAYGGSLDWSEALRTLASTTGSTAAEVMLNIFHQEPVKAFADAAAGGVGLIVKVPLDSGWLTGKYDAQSTFTDGRSRWSPEEIQRRAGLVDGVRFAAEETGWDLAQVALRFVLKFPEVSTVIPGVRSTEQLQSNLAASETPLPEDLFARLKSFFGNHIGNHPVPW